MAVAMGGQPTPRRGAALRQAMRDKAVQDLVYRSEYLATLVSEAAVLETTADDDSQQHLFASAVPRLVDSAVTVLQARADEARARPAQSSASVPFGGFRANAVGQSTSAWQPTSYPRAQRPVGVIHAHVENLKNRLDTLSSTGIQLLSERGRPNLDRNHMFHTTSTETSRKTYRDVVRPAVSVAHPASAVDDLHYKSTHGDVLEGMKTMVFGCISRGEQPTLGHQPELREQPKEEALAQTAADPLSTIRVQRVLGVPPAAFGGDHMHVTEMELHEHAKRSRCVEMLGKDVTLDLVTSGLDFARFFWRHSHANKCLDRGPPEVDPAEKGGAEADCCGARAKVPGRLCRVDGETEFSARRFSLMESGTLVVRQEAPDPFSVRALVVGDNPVKVLPRGHYVEVQIVSVFKTDGRPDRPRAIDHPRRRTEGLVLGFAAAKPQNKPHGSPLVANELPLSWSLSMSGAFNASAAAIKDAMSSVTGGDVDTFAMDGADLNPSATGVVPEIAVEDHATHRRKLAWCTGVGQGDTVGLLATTFGGIVLFVNGVRDLVVPDAGVCVDMEMYPIIEVYNHIRSVRLVPGAEPPS